MPGAQLEVVLTLLAGGPNRRSNGIAFRVGDQWEALDRRAAEYRLQPLLHTLWSDDDAIPETVRNRWKDAYRESAVAALRQRSELLAIVDLLARAGIEAMALKGAWLAWFAYAAPAERPLRDLDFLVRPERAVEAQELLLAHGFAQDDPGALPLAEWAKRFKHLPPLTSPGGTVVELHTRLWDKDGRNPPQPAGLFERAIVDPQHPQVRYPAPGDMLMHLAVHAAFHRFDGGPLMLVDFVRIVAVAGFDWPHTWARAEREGWLRAATIALEGARHWIDPDPKADVESPSRVPEGLVASLPWLLVKPQSARERDIATAKLSRRDIGLREKLRRVLARRERFRSLGDYLRWLSRETGAVLRARVAMPVQARRIARLDGWLSG